MKTTEIKTLWDLWTLGDHKAIMLELPNLLLEVERYKAKKKAGVVVDTGGEITLGGNWTVEGLTVFGNTSIKQGPNPPPIHSKADIPRAIMNTITISDLEDGYRNDITDLLDIAGRRIDTINQPLQSQTDWNLPDIETTIEITTSNEGLPI